MFWYFQQKIEKAVGDAIESDDPAQLEQILQDAGEDLHYYRDSDGGNLFHHAANAGSVEVIGYLIDAGLDVNNTDRGDNTPLIFASSIKDGDTRAEVTRMLIEAGADVNAEAYNKSVLHHHLDEWGTLGSIKLLIEAGADINGRVSDAFVWGIFGSLFNFLPSASLHT